MLGKPNYQNKGLIGPPFHPPHNLTRRHRWRTTHHDMHMVLAHHSLDDPYLKRFTRLSDQGSHSFGHFSRQDLIPVLGDPDKVVLNIEYRVASIPNIPCCTPSMPDLYPYLRRLVPEIWVKVSPKGFESRFTLQLRRFEISAVTDLCRGQNPGF